MKAPRILLTGGLILSVLLSLLTPVQAQPREQASVVVLFVDRATEGDKEWVTARIRNFLGNKVNGLYRVVPPEPFETRIKKLTGGTGGSERVLFDILNDSGADYALIAELANLKESGSMGMFRSSKHTNIGLDIQILDLVNGGFLKQGRFTGKAIDDNAVISIGDRLVALFTMDSQEITLAALDRLLFQVGEVISVNLPLAPPAKQPATLRP